MSEDRRTKAQILEALAESKSELEDMRTRLSAAESKLSSVRPVPVADAISHCVRALDRLKDTSRLSNSYGRNGEIENVIALLCDRYSVQRVQTVTEPCTRKHVEDLTASDVIGAIQGQVF